MSVAERESVTCYFSHPFSQCKVHSAKSGIYSSVPFDISENSFFVYSIPVSLNYLEHLLKDFIGQVMRFKAEFQEAGMRRVIIMLFSLFSGVLH